MDKVKKVVDEAAEPIITTVTELAETAGDIINNISLVLGVGFDAAMAALAGMPGLLIEWKTDLANWFDFDIEKFLTIWKDNEAKMKELQEP
ncbi:hypothetical protein ES703_102837 [subsurface metagenome]